MRVMRDELLWYKEQLPDIRMPTPTGEEYKRKISPLNKEKEHVLGEQENKKVAIGTGERPEKVVRIQQSANQRHCPNDFGRNRNLPPRLQNRK